MTKIVMMMTMEACVRRYSMLQMTNRISRSQQARRGLTNNISRIGAASTMVTDRKEANSELKG